ncbi:KinB-signaling pathway activation protein [Paenibacillus baekrokdamisoli]|uniref:KinB-signaling pathway activation protein n=1 Tax=Paenibacillus baekrokdamisoli TaxID=1712516 RepID=A0A3G9JMD1_9BACL|nr:KinB-signaling pathway activation protein [Paenibacillus baekrokdamisoli]MBB3073085.1 KinB signaling pathway activation protein [Paenibacillus baekrokdamisoli]BBH24034.1 KinB-signaling pathway activation protein [Paenibacillus baekrokdamisoli]
MNLRKWFFLFWSTMAVGGVVTTIVGSIMQWTDPSFGFMGLQAASFNALMMALVGLLFGAFSQMGFFAYLTLTYIALSVLRKSYLWNALQAYTTLFALGGLAYLLYQDREQLNNWVFWALPLALALGAWLVGYMKVKQTNNHAFIPTVFLLIVVTILEAWPSLQGEEANTTAIVFMVIPMFVCNAYQIMWLHHLVRKQEKADPAVNAKPAL